MTAIDRATTATWAMLAMAPILCGAGVLLVAFGDQIPPAARFGAVVVVAYLAGGLSWGYILVNLVMGEDVRDFGSGRTGMSNILRTAGGKAAALVFVMDAGKAILVVLLARSVVGTVESEVAAALVALCGHNWPVYLRFRGGRGILPGFGGLWLMAPWVALAGSVVFLVTTLSTRILSLGSIIGTITIAVISLALTVLMGHDQFYTMYVFAGGALIIWQHRDNIRRIANGTERKLGLPGLRNR